MRSARALSGKPAARCASGLRTMAAAISLRTIRAKCWGSAPRRRSMSWRFTGLHRASTSRNSPILRPTATSTSWKGKGGLMQINSFRSIRFLLFACAASLACQAGVACHQAVRSVPVCSGVLSRRTILRWSGPDRAPGFRFVLVNKTSREIRLAEPIPSSSHWYARAHDRWLWRASSGAGGSLLDAGNEHGRVMVYVPPGQGRDQGASPCRRTSPGNGSRASRRTLCLSTNLVADVFLSWVSASTRWSSPTRIGRAKASRPICSPVVCGLGSGAHAAEISEPSSCAGCAWFLSNHAPECVFL